MFDFFLHESYILSVSLDYCNNWAVKWMNDALAWSNVCAKEIKLWSYISGAEEITGSFHPTRKIRNYECAILLSGNWCLFRVPKGTSKRHSFVSLLSETSGRACLLLNTFLKHGNTLFAAETHISKYITVV